MSVDLYNKSKEILIGNNIISGGLQNRRTEILIGNNIISVGL